MARSVHLGRGSGRSVRRCGCVSVCWCRQCRTLSQSNRCCCDSSWGRVNAICSTEGRQVESQLSQQRRDSLLMDRVGISKLFFLLFYYFSLPTFLLSETTEPSADLSISTPPCNMNPTIVLFAVLWLTVNTIWTSPLPTRARSEQSHEFWNIFKVWIKQWDFILKQRCADSRMEWFLLLHTTQFALYMVKSRLDFMCLALFRYKLLYKGKKL